MSRRNLGELLLFAALSFVVATVAAAKEVKVKLAECPLAVQKTLQREAAGAKIDEVAKEVEDGETTFEADVTIDGKEYEITVAEDGTLLEKSLEEEDEEQKGDANSSDWMSTFSVDKANLVPTGKNPFFSLEPGQFSQFEGGNVKLTITVLDETKVVDGVETRVVEEREERGHTGRGFKELLRHR